MDQIIKDATGKPQGVIRQLAGGREELLNLSGEQIAMYDPHRDATYDRSGSKIGSGNRLLGLA